MKIKYVEIKNILSIEDLRLEFADSGLVLLDGWNYDDDTANGAGKTAIFNSLAFGLYGKVPRKISISEVLRDGTKSGYVKVGIDLDGNTFEVVRARPNSLKFFENNDEIIMTQEEFESKIKLNYNQYLISMYSAQTEGLKLISMNDTSKKDFFLQLMNLDKLTDCKKSTDAKLKELSAELISLNNSKTEYQSKIDVYAESVVDEEELQEKIKELDPTPMLNKLKKLQAIPKPDTSKFDDLEEKLREYWDNLNDMELEQKNKRYKFKELKKEIESLEAQDISNHNIYSCPECSAELAISSSWVKTVEELKEQHKRNIADLKVKATALVSEINSFPAIDAEKQKVIEKIEKCKTKRNQELQTYNEALESISELRSKIAIRKSAIDSHNAAIAKNDELKERLAKLKLKFQEILKRISHNQSQQQVLEAVSTLFGPSGAPAYIMDAAVDTFNERIASHVSLIWPNASYTLQSFKENKSGDIKAKFSEKLIINGREKSTGSLSGGEFRCLSIALDFAVIEVLESMFGISLNPIMMDEPFNDLDASNRERVIELLEKLAANRQIWIIDHASEAKAMFSNVVRVEKRDGISRLV